MIPARASCPVRPNGGCAVPGDTVELDRGWVWCSLVTFTGSLCNRRWRRWVRGTAGVGPAATLRRAATSASRSAARAGAPGRIVEAVPEVAWPAARIRPFRTARGVPVKLRGQARPYSRTYRGSLPTRVGPDHEHSGSSPGPCARAPARASPRRDAPAGQCGRPPGRRAAEYAVPPPGRGRAPLGPGHRKRPRACSAQVKRYRFGTQISWSSSSVEPSSR